MLQSTGQIAKNYNAKEELVVTEDFLKMHRIEQNQEEVNLSGRGLSKEDIVRIAMYKFPKIRKLDLRRTSIEGVARASLARILHGLLYTHSIYQLILLTVALNPSY